MVTLLIGRVLQIILSVCQIRLATTLLEPSEYGIWILFLTVVSFCVLLAVSPFGLYLNRHINDWNNNKLMPEVFRGYNSYLLVITAVSFVFFIFIQLFKIYTTESIILSSVMLAILLFTQTFSQTWISILNLFGRRKSFVIASLLTTALGLIFVLIFAFLGYKSVYWWGTGISLGLLIGTLIFIPKDWYQFDLARFKDFKRALEFKDILSFSGPLFFTTLFFWFQTQGYRFLIEKKIGLEEFGKFAAGQAVVSGLFTALDSVIAGYYQPTFFKNISTGSPVSIELRQVWDIALYPFILAGCYLYLLAPDISVLFLNQTFIGETSWISWVALAEGFRVIFNLLVMNFQGTKKTSSLVFPHAIGLVITVFFIYRQEDLTFIQLSLFLSLGYLISILLLFLIDFKNFYSSKILTKLATVLMIVAVYYGFGYYIHAYFSGGTRVIILSLLGVIFMAPYYFKNVRSKP